MKRYGARNKIRHTVAKHQHCGICHPHSTPGRAIEKQRARQEIEEQVEESMPVYVNWEAVSSMAGRKVKSMSDLRQEKCMKLFFAHMVSESSDHYNITFKASKKPQSDEDWKPIIQGELPGEWAIYEQEPYGPGLCGTWVYCEEITEVDLDNVTEYE